MDLFEKQDKIVEMYITREYTIPKLANENWYERRRRCYNIAFEQLLLWDKAKFR